MSHTHAAVELLTRPEGCATCHTETGLADGCLSCHEEISAQLQDRRGYHATLTDPDNPTCGSCHPEHLGEGFPITSRLSWGAQVAAAFRHPHVEFALKGDHTELTCDQCHVDHREESFQLPQFPDRTRHQTFLGLDQTCSSCHDDPHSGGHVEKCGSCHGQNHFDPPEFFDHAEHFALAGGHDNLDCASCHTFPAPVSESQRRDRLKAGRARSDAFPFDTLRGRSCVECHQAPHRAEFDVTCDVCHPGDDPHWTNAAETMTPELHAQVGFRLDDPHSDVACSKCHTPGLPFAKRHPNPSAVGYRRFEDTCSGCHEDVHKGQFAGRYDRCLDCHERQRFAPSTFGHDAHAKEFALVGAHLGVACSSCHERSSESGERRFSGTTHSCQQCHDDPHAGQFAAKLAAGDCTSCHRPESDTFEIEPFDHAARTGVPLTGAHARADCRGCHFSVPMQAADGSEVVAQRFVGTPQACASCHEDNHRGQFADYAGCESCHTSDETWLSVDFDHERQSRFKLTGAHAKLLCSSCHLPTSQEDGSEFIQYKPLGIECRSCHEVEAPKPR